jgi:ADP-heptose:LPS heptosyltransferase
LQRIAILKPSALGDIAHALPVLAGLRAAHPLAQITWIVNKSFEPLLAGHPHLDATLAFDRDAFRRGPLASVKYLWRLSETLRKQRFDLVVDLQGLLRTGLMCGMSGAPRRVGFAEAREGAARFYTECVSVPDADRIHAVDRYWRIAVHLGATGVPQFHLPVSAAEREEVRAEFRGLPRPWVAVAVGAKWITKRWPPRFFGETLRMLQGHSGGTAIFLGTGADTADSLEAASALSGPWRDNTGKTPLPRLVAMLAECDLMLGNDTGPLHLAAALGTPCVAPYLCTSTALHGPYRQFGGVETNVPCGGSYLKQCPRGKICMDELTPARLWPSLTKALAQCRTAA